jgi:hypothetical protein
VLLDKDLHNLDDNALLEILRARDREAGKDSGQPKRRRRFVQVPDEWVERLKGARHIGSYRLAFYLLFENWRLGGGQIAVSNVVAETIGLVPRVKWRALRELEALGLIKIETRSRSSPLVMVLLDGII